MPPTSLSFQKFDYCDTDIYIPENTIFYRGVPKHINKNNTNSIIRDLPLYIAPEYIAKHYGPKVIPITNKRPLRLIDVRRLKNHLRLILTTRNSKTSLQSLFYLTIAFGLCSYKKQVELMEDFLKNNKTNISTEAQNDIQQRLAAMKSYNLSQSPLNPFEPEGVRIAETYIDGHVMLILRELYSGIYDGYIAPRLVSPFHTNNVTHEEIVIFNPIESDMTIYTYKTPPIQTLDIQILLGQQLQSFTLSYKHMYHRKIFMKGGTSQIKEQDRNAFFDDIQNTRLIQKGIKSAESFAKQYKHPPQRLKPIFNIGLTIEPIIPEPSHIHWGDC